MSELSPEARAVRAWFERLVADFAAQSPAEQVAAVFSTALTIGILAFLFYRFVYAPINERSRGGIRVFISYRRADTQPITGRLYDRLVTTFGPRNVFLDIDQVPYGTDFHAHVQKRLKRCDVFIAVIGEHWRAVGADGSARLDDAADLVRVEVESALALFVPVIPVLVVPAQMPSAAELPESLQPLRALNAPPLDSGRDFNEHARRIVSAVRTEARRPRRRPRN